MARRIIADVVMFIFILLIYAQVMSVKKSVEKERESAISPVFYEELIPDKEEYYPGDLVRFTYVRHATVKSSPILMLTVDSFENLETGEIFTGTFGSRTVKESGMRVLNATRRLSADASPGTYAFEGWASIQGSIMPRPIAYSSREFTVKPRPGG